MDYKDGFEAALFNALFEKNYSFAEPLDGSYTKNGTHHPGFLPFTR